MTLLREVRPNAAVGVGVTHDPDNLTIIKKPGCAAAIWQRQPMAGFQTWIDALHPDRLPATRCVLRPDQMSDTLVDLCEAASLPEGPHRQHLIADIANLGRIFCDVMRAPFVRLRLDRVTTNACRRFHIDALTARLVCTYRGTGTQYGISSDGADPKRVFTVPTGSPILLRGTLWPEQPASGLLHRSPPIEGTGETRLVLVLDPMFAPEDEL